MAKATVPDGVRPRTADVQKMLKVTFSHGLPLGTKGTFTYEGEPWIAYPSKKNQRIFAVTDRLLGTHKRMIQTMTQWINERPQDTELAIRVIGIANAAMKLHDELLHEKVEAKVEIEESHDQS